MIMDLWGTWTSTIVNGKIVLPKNLSSKFPDDEKLVVTFGLNSSIAIYPKSNFIESIKTLNATQMIKKQKLAALMIQTADEQTLTGPSRFRIPQILIHRLNHKLPVVLQGEGRYITVKNYQDAKSLEDNMKGKFSDMDDDFDASETVCLYD